MIVAAEPVDISRRIAHLSAEKRELLRKLLDRPKETDGLPADPAPPSGADLRITRDVVSGAEGQAQGRQLYELFNRNLDKSPFAGHAVFLNLGYVADASPRLSPVELPRHCLNRNCTQLALEVIADVDLAGRDVADVGCGRGGTIAVMRAHFSPRLVVGVDFSRSALLFCRRSHRFEATHFVEGNAQVLPLPSARFDVLTSIESASGYPDVLAFYREVARVLRPGGYFLYADVVPRDALVDRRRQLAEIGLRIESERDITANVLLSCDETARTHRAAVAGEHDEDVLGDFLGLPDSNVYRRMRDGALRYLICKGRRMER